ncbi:MAG: glutamine-hydrolyzing GMP synthase [Candidatus Pacebacteria bacterium]|nr:glutamine-hydrolyzing GMP synthase [Candidatus Paceibacterota bacterium]
MIAVIDFGSQLAHLITRRLAQLGVDAALIDPEEALDQIKHLKPSGLILSGGPASVSEPEAPTIDAQVFSLDLPVLGICYGWQLMAKLLGGKVESTTKEYGPEILEFSNNLFQLPQKSISVFMSHGDSVTQLPVGFSTLGSTKTVKQAAVADLKRQLFGLQFHPEADHTELGLDQLQYFAETVCQEKISQRQLDLASLITKIKKQVKDKKVICAVSGGVDSTVAAFLIGKAIGPNLIPVHVKSGLMRPQTEKLVQKIFSQYVQAELVVIDAQKQFMKALKGVTDPEKKRKIIGRLYIELFEKEAKKHDQVEFLGQGTIYSDVIESQGSKKASKIKSHHNVGGLPEKMNLKLIEPIRNFYKDEVRELGRIAGLPEEIIMQEPFPGPGFAIRIRGEVTPKRLKQEKRADAIVQEEIKAANLHQSIFQCFAVMTGAYSTAVKGDARAFAEVVAARAYESKDIMTSQWAQIPYEVLQIISSRIVNEVPDVSRVVYDISTKPPATMEWE